MKKPIVFMYSGQGSQYYQMGKDLYLKDSTFKKWMNYMDEIVGEIISKSIINILYSEEKRKDTAFDRVLYTHPAIFMIEYAMTQVLIHRGIKPDYVLGSSLGEFAAIAASGVLKLEDVLKLVVKQAMAFEGYCERGRMLAVIYNHKLYREASFLFDNSELASVNYDSHFVIAGHNNKIDTIEGQLNSMGITAFMLPVTYAFHSSLIENAGVSCISDLKGLDFKKPEVPLVSCLYGKIISKVHKEYLWDIVRNPINFRGAFKTLEANNDFIYLDLGPSDTMANFAKNNLKENSLSEVYSIISPFGNEKNNLDQIERNFTVMNMKNLQSNILTESARNEERGKNMLAFVFPGQGSQKKGMGGSIFDQFSDLVAKADDILGYSIKELCLEDPKNQLDNTRYTQPAIYVVSTLSYLMKIKETKRKPDYVAGHSLGEYSALFASGAFDFETGLKLVKKRGEIMSRVSGGGMAAVLGLNRSQVEIILKENELECIDIANLNSETQIVLSGLVEDIKRAKPIFETAEGVKRYIQLVVSGAFHSRYMTDARKEFEEYIQQFTFSELNIPVISNAYARPYKKDEIKRYLAEQIDNSVKWYESVKYLMVMGEIEFVEVGPGNVLKAMISKIQNEITQDEIEKMRLSIHNEIEDDNKVRYEYHNSVSSISPMSLGNSEFKKDYNINFAYVTGGMYKGIASKELVVRLGKAGMMAFFGTGGLSLQKIEDGIQYIQKELSQGQAYGMNIVHNPQNPEMEEHMIDLFMRYGVRNLEAAAYLNVTPALVKFRVKGLIREKDGKVSSTNKIIAKISRPEVAEIFLTPIPKRILEKLVAQKKITSDEASLAEEIAIVDDLCAEADSAGHTDGASMFSLLPAIITLRDKMMEKYKYNKKIRVGAAGGIGTPEAAASSFILGADFIMTGSINQCTVESATSDSVKDLLQTINVQDTDYAPAGDTFELGAKCQVLKRGVFFPTRANTLYELYCRYNSLDEIDEKTKMKIQEKYFKRSFGEVYKDVKAYYNSDVIEKAEKYPKHKMALIFKWYFWHSTQLALTGSDENKVDYQIPCGPALGAFNQWVKGTKYENWRKRHVDEIGEKIMVEAAQWLDNKLNCLKGQQ